MIIKIFDPSLAATTDDMIETKSGTRRMFYGFPYSSGCNNVTVSINSFRTDEIYEFQLDFYTEQNSYVLSTVKMAIENKVLVAKEAPVPVASFNVDSAQIEIRDAEAIYNGCKNARFSDYAVVRFFKEAYDAAKNQQCAQRLLQLYCTTYRGKETTIANLIVFYNHMETIEALGKNLFCTLGDGKFNLPECESNQRHKLIGLPKYVTNWIANSCEDHEKTESTKLFQDILGEDPNELIAIAEYFEDQLKTLKKIPQRDCSNWRAYNEHLDGSKVGLLKAMKKLRAVSDVDLRKALSYCIKQKFNKTYIDKNLGIDNAFRYAVAIPEYQMSLYADYMATKPEVQFPQNLVKAHNIAMLEAKAEINEKDEKKFSAYGEKLAITHNYKKGSYRFEVPVDYKRFIEVGKTFLNCIPLCGVPFYSGLCDIVFLYENDNPVPKYALETDKLGFVIQAKQRHDFDVDDEIVMNAILEYEKWLVKSLQDMQQLPF